MHWAAPAYAWLLLLIVPAAILLRLAARNRKRTLMELTGDRGGTPPLSWRVRRGLARTLQAAAFMLIVAALCRPQWGQVATQQHSQGLDILIALDVSRSMLADDVSPNRLEAAKAAVAGLLPRLRGDRIGLIAFAGSAFLVCPLTTDYGTFAEVLAELGPESLPLGGTSLAGALNEARRSHAGRSEGGRILILISDGEDHGNEADAAAALRGAGIAVYSVMAGTPKGGLIPLPGGDFLRSPDGAIVKSSSRSAALQAIAAATGGYRLDLSADRKALETLYATDLSKRERRDVHSTRYQLAERFQIPLALALLLLFIEPFVIARSKP